MGAAETKGSGVSCGLRMMLRLWWWAWGQCCPFQVIVLVWDLPAEHEHPRRVVLAALSGLLGSWLELWITGFDGF